MEKEVVLNLIEDKEIKVNNDWYLHATKNDIETIRKILDEGIKSAYLRGQKGNHFNGRYYISLYKYNNESEALISWLINHPKFIIQNISPFYADRSKYKLRHFFVNTRIPLRTSEWDGEFHQYLKIEPSKIIALEYSLSYILSKSDNSNLEEQLKFLKSMILCMEQLNKDLPIYDLSSNRELNKQKILSLHF